MKLTEIADIRALHTLVGCEVGVSDWLVMTQDRIAAFAELTDDRQWIHLDSERTARESPYGAPVAHGFLLLSLLTPFFKQVIRICSGYAMGLNYGLNRVRFPAPVLAGQLIRASFVLVAVEEFDAGVQAVLRATVEVERGVKPCCVAEWVIRYYDGATV